MIVKETLQWVLGLIEHKTKLQPSYKMSDLGRDLAAYLGNSAGLKLCNSDYAVISEAVHPTGPYCAPFQSTSSKALTRGEAVDIGRASVDRLAKKGYRVIHAVASFPSDAIVLEDPERVLVRAQTDPEQNGTFVSGDRALYEAYAEVGRRYADWLEHSRDLPADKPLDHGLFVRKDKLDEAVSKLHSVEAEHGTDRCDECDGSGFVKIDGVAEECVCKEETPLSERMCSIREMNDQLIGAINAVTLFEGDSEWPATLRSLQKVIAKYVKRSGAAVHAEEPPVPMLLHCPMCSKRHIDEGAFAHGAHHTHACQYCGFVWRPAVCFTVGVQFLPGFKNKE